MAGTQKVGSVDPEEHISVTVLLRRRSGTNAVARLVEGLTAQPPLARRHLSRAEFAEAHGAADEDIQAIEAFAHDHALDIVEVKPAERRVVLSGSAASLSDAFGVELARYDHPSGTGTYRGRVGPVHVPENLADIVVGVFGLDNRPQAYPHHRLNRQSQAEGQAQAHAAGSSFTPPQLAKFYDFPEDADGSGECIALIELGGGFRTSDLTAYFNKLGVKRPKVVAISVDGGKNKPTGDPGGEDGEVVLDIDVAGGVAPGARIAVYFAPNSDKGFLDAVLAAVHDTRNKPSVISISWGSAEINWTPQSMRAMDQAFKDAAALGVTVCCAAGDDGSSDLRPPQEDDHLLHVDFPSSSPFVLACGGTRVTATAGTSGEEIVWNEGRGGGATGGGISDFFDKPVWQASIDVPPSGNPGGRIGRGVPDVSGNADPQTGYVVRVDGSELVFGGTSAVAPLWAGLIARLNEKLGGNVGYLNPTIYGLPGDTGAFRDIVAGDNDIAKEGKPYKAGRGWDACTGLGSPNGAGLLATLSSAPSV